MWHLIFHMPLTIWCLLGGGKTEEQTIYAVTLAQKCCVTHLILWEKISLNRFYCTVSEQTLPGEMSWSGVVEIITALLIFYINIVIQD